MNPATLEVWYTKKTTLSSYAYSNPYIQEKKIPLVETIIFVFP